MPLPQPATPLKRQTLGGDVYAQLRELLTTGQMMPGEPMSLRRTAEALGVSVMPVRDAINRLVAEQALEVAPNRSVRVPRMTISQFREIALIRTNLEGLATETAATNLGAADIAEIDAFHRRFAAEMARPKPDGARLIAFNKTLHFAVYRGARMPMLMLMIESLWLRIGPILNYDLRSDARRLVEGAAANWHGRLVQALQARDSQAARRAIEGDIENAADYIVNAGVLIASDAAKPLTAPATAARGLK